MSLFCYLCYLWFTNGITNIEYQRILFYVGYFIDNLIDNKGSSASIFDSISNNKNCEIFSINPFQDEIAYNFISNMIFKYYYYSNSNIKTQEYIIHKYLYQHRNGYPNYIIKPYLDILFVKRRTIDDVDIGLSITPFNNNVYTPEKTYLKLQSKLSHAIKLDRSILIIAIPKNKGNIMTLSRYNKEILSIQFYSNIAKYLWELINIYGLYFVDVNLYSIVILYNDDIKFGDLNNICVPRYNTAPTLESIGLRVSVNICDTIPLFSDVFYAPPEFKKINWDIDKEQSISWNIGYMIYQELSDIYDDYYGTSFTMSNANWNIETFSGNAKVLMDSKWILGLPNEKVNKQYCDELRYKQMLFELIIPLPKNDAVFYAFPNSWNPKYRVNIQRIISLLQKDISTIVPL